MTCVDAVTFIWGLVCFVAGVVFGILIVLWGKYDETPEL